MSRSATPSSQKLALSNNPHGSVAALFADCVIPRSCLMLLQSEPVETRDVEDMGRGPAVESFAHICGDALLAGYRDEVGDETLFDWIVDLRKTHHRRLYALRA